jgi:putative PIN family toxin of toxin-antitoxin system
MKVVLDSNVILAALGTRGLCEAVVTVCLESHQIILSEYILDEVGRHLRGKFKMPVDQVRERMDFLRRHCLVVVPVEVGGEACEDARDLPVLGTALAVGAPCLITGDKGLLMIGNFKSVAILGPRAFYDHIKGNGSRE